MSQLPIETPLGTHVPLSDVAEIALVPAPNEIKREGASRKIDVTCNVQGRDLGSVAREIEKRVRALDFEREYHPEFLGEYAAREESTTPADGIGRTLADRDLADHSRRLSLSPTDRSWSP